MKKSLMGVVIAFISLAVLGVSGCATIEEIHKRAEIRQRKREAELAKIKCDPERRTKKLGDTGKLMLFVSPTWTSSAASWSFANSSGTMGCGNNDEPSAYIQQQEFVAWNIDNLSEQIAQGGGPHLQSLSALLGCPASDYPALAGMARRDFGRLFPSTDLEPEAFLARLKDHISHNFRLSESCVYA